MKTSGRRIRLLLLHLVDSERQYGGVEKVVLDLATRLPHDQTDVVLGVNRGIFADRAAKADVPLCLIEAKGKWDVLSFWKQLRDLSERFQPDIVHSHHRFTTLCAQVLPGRRYRLVHTFHVEQFTWKWLRFFGDYATAVSHGVKEHFVRDFGVESHRVTVIYNGVEKPKGILSELPLRRSGQINIVVVGRLEEQKGHEYIIRSFDYMNPEFLNRINVVFVGEGTKRPVLEKMLVGKRSGLVEFSGFRENVWPYFERADFTVLPSLWEGFGLTIIESYLCGKPVIGSRVGAIPEILKDGETGLLVPPKDPQSLADAIRTFGEDAEMVQRYGAHAKKFAESFSIEKMIAGYQQLYARLLQTKTLPLPDGDADT
jgi:glycosyltransferase involved in cell wall biosynthesis